MKTSFENVDGAEFKESLSKLKSPEEIKQYETPEDMPEVARIIHLLKKGKPEQKIAVIQNLQRVLLEPKGPDQVFQLLINSIFLYEKRMQAECAKSFIMPAVLKALTVENKRGLLKQAIEIFNSTDCQLYEQLYQDWVSLCSEILPDLALELINDTLLELIKTLCQQRNPYRYRKYGYLLLEAILKTKHTEAWNTDTQYKSIVYSMVRDTNWRIRKQFCVFTFRLLQPLKEFENLANEAQVQNAKENQNQTLKRRNTINSVFMSKNSAGIYEVVKTGWASAIFEILTSNEPQVVLEALNVMQEYYFVFTKKNFVDYFKPHFIRMLLNVSFKNSAHSFKLAFAKHCGPLMNRMIQLDLLDENFKVKIYQFFKTCYNSDQTEPQNLTQSYQDDPDLDIEIREMLENQNDSTDHLCVLATYNLPCFFKHLQGLAIVEQETTQRRVSEPSPKSKSSFKKEEDVPMEILRRAKMMCNLKYPQCVRKILAASIHELFYLKPNYTYVNTLLSMYLELINASSQETELIAILCQNLSKVLGSFLANIDIDGFLAALFTSRVDMIKQISAGSVETVSVNSPVSISGMQPQTFQKAATMKIYQDFQATSLLQKSNLTSARKKKGDLFKLPKQLHKLVPLHTIPQSYTKEITSARLLHLLEKLLKIMIARPGGCRAEMVHFLKGLGDNLSLFNACLVDSLFRNLLVAQLPFQSEKIKKCIFFFLAQLLHAHYDKEMRDQLIKMVIDTFAKGQSVADRCHFIMFINASVQVLDADSFQVHFIPELKTFLESEKHALVLNYFVKMLPEIWTHIISYTLRGVDCFVGILQPFPTVEWPEPTRLAMIRLNNEFRSSFQVLREDRDWVVSMQKHQEQASKWTEEKARRYEYQQEQKRKKNQDPPKIKAATIVPVPKNVRQSISNLNAAGLARLNQKLKKKGSIEMPTTITLLPKQIQKLRRQNTLDNQQTKKVVSTKLVDKLHSSLTDVGSRVESSKNTDDDNNNPKISEIMKSDSISSDSSSFDCESKDTVDQMQFEAKLDQNAKNLNRRMANIQEVSEYSKSQLSEQHKLSDEIEDYTFPLSETPSKIQQKEEDADFSKVLNCTIDKNQANKEDSDLTDLRINMQISVEDPSSHNSYESSNQSKTKEKTSKVGIKIQELNDSSLDEDEIKGWREKRGDGSAPGSNSLVKKEGISPHTNQLVKMRANFGSQRTLLGPTGFGKKKLDTKAGLGAILLRAQTISCANDLRTIKTNTRSTHKSSEPEKPQFKVKNLLTPNSGKSASQHSSQSKHSKISRRISNDNSFSAIVSPIVMNNADPDLKFSPIIETDENLPTSPVLLSHEKNSELKSRNEQLTILAGSSTVQLLSMNKTKEADQQMQESPIHLSEDSAAPKITFVNSRQDSGRMRDIHSYDAKQQTESFKSLESQKSNNSKGPESMQSNHQMMTHGGIEEKQAMAKVHKLDLSDLNAKYLAPKLEQELSVSTRLRPDSISPADPGFDVRTLTSQVPLRLPKFRVPAETNTSREVASGRSTKTGLVGETNLKSSKNNGELSKSKKKSRLKDSDGSFLLKTVAVRIKESMKPLESNTQRGLPPGKLKKAQVKSYAEIGNEERIKGMLPFFQIRQHQKLQSASSNHPLTQRDVPSPTILNLLVPNERNTKIKGRVPQPLSVRAYTEQQQQLFKSESFVPPSLVLSDLFKTSKVQSSRPHHRADPQMPLVLCDAVGNPKSILAKKQQKYQINRVQPKLRDSPAMPSESELVSERLERIRKAIRKVHDDEFTVSTLQLFNSTKSLDKKTSFDVNAGELRRIQQGMINSPRTEAITADTVKPNFLTNQILGRQSQNILIKLPKNVLLTRNRSLPLAKEATKETVQDDVEIKRVLSHFLLPKKRIQFKDASTRVLNKLLTPPKTKEQV